MKSNWRDKKNGRRWIRSAFGNGSLLAACAGMMIVVLCYKMTKPVERRTEGSEKQGIKAEGRQEKNAREEDSFAPPIADDIQRRAVPRPPSARPKTYTPITVAADAKRQEADLLAGLLFFLPPEQQRQSLMQRLHSIMSAGTRVAGSLSSGQMKVMKLLTENGTWRPPREALFTPKGVSNLKRVPVPRWSLEWDNFTHSTPLGERKFFNLVFTFAGGAAFKRKSHERETKKENRGNFSETRGRDQKRGENEKKRKGGGEEGKRRRGRRKRRSFAFSSNHTFAEERLKHVMLSAHWDSKYYTDINFLGASDSAVPLVYLLETMRLISVLSDTVAALSEAGNKPRWRNSRATDHDDEALCRWVPRVLSPSYLTVLRYYYAQDRESSACLSGVTGSLWQRRSMRNSKTSAKRQVGGGFLQLLRRVNHLPAITVALFDGEEAFVRWEGDDNTYGSSHLAKMWKMMNISGNMNAGGNVRMNKVKVVNSMKVESGSVSEDSEAAASSRFNSIDLFILYDLMGSAGTQFQNFFPDQSGIAFARLADVERMHRREAAELWRLQEEAGKVEENKRKWWRSETTSKSSSAAAPASDASRISSFKKACSKYLPRLWCLHGPPHEMFTLYGVPRLDGTSLPSSELANLWLPPASGDNAGSTNTNNDEKNSEVGRNVNVFFPSWQARAQGPILEGISGVMDDHTHWLETERVLHLIPIPFPPAWHTAQDNESEIDGGTVVDLFRVLSDFSLRLGEGWMDAS